MDSACKSDQRHVGAGGWISRVTLLLGLCLAVGGCLQAEGEPCQVDADCEKNLKCTASGGLRGTCEKSENLDSDDDASAAGTSSDEDGTGGDDAATGGDDTATGGDDTATGGDDTATGGDDAATGGDDAATGGDDTATGGASEA